MRPQYVSALRLHLGGRLVVWSLGAHARLRRCKKGDEAVGFGSFGESQFTRIEEMQSVNATWTDLVETPP
jgi:hypothetical protein